MGKQKPEFLAPISDPSPLQPQFQETRLIWPSHMPALTCIYHTLTQFRKTCMCLLMCQCLRPEVLYPPAAGVTGGC